MRELTLEINHTAAQNVKRHLPLLVVCAVMREYTQRINRLNVQYVTRNFAIQAIWESMKGHTLIRSHLAAQSVKRNSIHLESWEYILVTNHTAVLNATKSLGVQEFWNLMREFTLTRNHFNAVFVTGNFVIQAIEENMRRINIQKFSSLQFKRDVRILPSIQVTCHLSFK